MIKTYSKALRLVSLAIFSIALFAIPKVAGAAACSNANNYGTATMTVSIPATGDYRIWSRMKVPSTTNSTYQLEADGNTCWQVGGTNVAVNSWTWVDWSGSNNLQKINYTFTTTGNHTLKLIGSATNVEVDKVILLGAGELCSDGSTLPTGDGSNCATGPTASNSGGTTAPTPVNTPVTGTTTPSVVQQNQSNAAETQYYVDGKLVQTSSGAGALDTSKLTDGTHKLDTVVTLKDGTKVADSQTVIVKNHRSIYEKYKTIILSFMVLASLAVIIFSAWYLWFRSHPIVASNIFSKGSKSIASSGTLTSNYHEPTVISPDTTTQSGGANNETPKS